MKQIPHARPAHKITYSFISHYLHLHMQSMSIDNNGRIHYGGDRTVSA